MSKFRELMENYSNQALVDAWFSRRKYPNVKEITKIFRKSAGDFKAGKVSLKNFSDICGELYFSAYLGDRKKFPSSLTIQDRSGKIRAAIVKVHKKKNGEYSVTRRKLPPLKPDIDLKIVQAMSAFSDPRGNEATKRWRLKKEFWDKYLGFM